MFCHKSNAENTKIINKVNFVDVTGNLIVHFYNSEFIFSHESDIDYFAADVWLLNQRCASNFATSSFQFSFQLH